jgi:ribosomal protein S18 acetylase RimI-like enzyme
MFDLHPMAEAEYQVFKDWLLEDYAQEIARNYRIPREDARKASAADIAGLLTDGLATPNHYLYHIVTAAPPDAPGPHAPPASSALRALPTARTAPDQPADPNAAGALVRIGYLWIIVDDHKRACFIAQIYLHPEFRGQGFGRKTLELLQARMQQRGIRRINLHVFADNTTAQHLYRRLGYETTDINMQKWLEDETGPTSPAI